MKRLIALTLVMALVLALALPGMAFAKKGGVPANGKDNGRGSIVAPAELPDDVGKNKPKDKAKDEPVPAEELEGEELEGEEAPDLESDDEVAEEPAEKLTGIENALSRLQRNLERKQAQFQAGLRKGLPSGLQATIAKFMSWLGMAPPDEIEGGNESNETSPTVEPELPEDEIENADDTSGAPADAL